MLLVVVLGSSDCAVTSLKICDRLTAILKPHKKFRLVESSPLILNVTLFMHHAFYHNIALELLINSQTNKSKIVSRELFWQML